MRKILYVGMDVHADCTVIAVIDAGGKQLMQSVVQTDASVLLDCLRGLRGADVHVTFEESTQAEWLFDLLNREFKNITVCDPRRNDLLKEGNKNDSIDALKLAELLRSGMLRPVYHAGDQSMRELKELVKSYERLVQDSVRTKLRIKSIFRARGIRYAGREVYRESQRAKWLEKLEDAGARGRAGRLYRELDAVEKLRREACREMIKESRRHRAHSLLMTMPELGAVRVAQILAIVENPQRFRTKRQLWTYVGLAVVMRTTSEYEVTEHGRIRRRQKVVESRGLNQNYNRRLKYVFKAAATRACHRTDGVYREWYEKLISGGMRAEMARLTVARKLAATALRVWKSGQAFDEKRVVVMMT